MRDAFVLEGFGVEPVREIGGGGEALQMPEGDGDVGAGPGVGVAFFGETGECVGEDRLGLVGLQGGSSDGVPRSSHALEMEECVGVTWTKELRGVVERPEI